MTRHVELHWKEDKEGMRDIFGRDVSSCMVDSVKSWALLLQ